MNKTSSLQKAYLDYIKHHPGCTRTQCIQDVNLHNFRASAYASVAQLIKRSFVHIKGQGLFITDKGWEVCRAA